MKHQIKEKEATTREEKSQCTVQILNIERIEFCNFYVICDSIVVVSGR